VYLHFGVIKSNQTKATSVEPEGLPSPLPSGGLKTAVVAVKAVTAVKAVAAVGGPNWELQLPIRSSNIYISCHSSG